MCRGILIWVSTEGDIREYECGGSTRGKCVGKGIKLELLG